MKQDTENRDSKTTEDKGVPRMMAGREGGGILRQQMVFGLMDQPVLMGADQKAVGGFS